MALFSILLDSRNFMQCLFLLALSPQRCEFNKKGVDFGRHVGMAAPRQFGAVFYDPGGAYKYVLLPGRSCIESYSFAKRSRWLSHFMLILPLDAARSRPGRIRSCREGLC